MKYVYQVMLDHVSYCAGLLSLGLSHNYITNEGAGSLADLLLSNDTLQSLIISNNNIGSEGANSIVAALTDNRTLTALYLADVTIKHNVFITLYVFFFSESFER